MDADIRQPAWSAKQAEGKMFRRLQCQRCHSSYMFSDAPRITRLPVCPACGCREAETFAA